jgi:chitodextrinase
MKKSLLLIVVFSITSLSFSQTDKFWSASAERPENITKDKGVARQSFPTEFKLLYLNLEAIRTELFTVVGNQSRHSTVISLPNADGNIEQFEVFEASNFEPDLQAQFPEIRAFSGKGITDRYATLKLSISPKGIQTMVFRTDKANEFIEPYSADHTVYAIFKSQREKGKLAWTCSTDEQNMVADISAKGPENSTLSNDGQLRVWRLAQSCNAEYANYFGATSAAQVNLVLAAFNNTLARCNGVYEKDLGVHLNLVASSTNVIYYDAATDPYTAYNVGNGLDDWNTQLQIALNTTLTGSGTALATNNAAYDIGHMFGRSGGGGNAGCIGCVCVNGAASGTGSTKGRGITSPADNIPTGDNFDIDYVVHEVGHQLGGTHTFSFSTESALVNKEVGSGITIMGYAGITNYDLAPHSIDIFHETSIAQIQANIATKSCGTITSISVNNAAPVVANLTNYTIPITTPFVLTGSATDANVGDVLTYCWEQNDNASGAAVTGANSTASIGKLTGPNFLSWAPTASPSRYFPKLSSVIANSATTSQVSGDAGMLSEALSSVARTLNFRLTVRDNCPYSSTAPLKVGQTNFKDMVVTVTAAAGPFTVSAPNTAVSWAAGSTQTVTWNVAGTTANGVNCANVDILLSTDGGLTYPITILSATPNITGSASITIPNNIGTTNRIMVKGTNHIFFDISNTNFTIAADTTAPTAPTLTASGTTINSTNLSWSGATDNVAVTSYDVYKNGVFLINVIGTTYTAGSLTPNTAYTFYVRAKDAAGNASVNSNTVNVNTADTTAPTAPTLAASSTTINSTNLSWSGATDNVAVTSYDVYKNGVFLINTAGTNYTAGSLVPNTAYSFYVRAKDAAGNASSNSNTVNITTTDTTPPTAPTLTASNTTINSTDLSWSGATDNVAVTSYDVYKNGVFLVNTASSPYTAGGLTLNTPYTFYVKAKDTAGNVSGNSNTVNVTPTDTTNPSAPTLAASNTTINSTDLSWSGATDNVAVTSYDVYKNGVFLLNTASSPYTAGGLTLNTPYTFYVKAKDAAGNVSGNSNTVNVTPTDTTNPSAPTLSASNTTINSTDLSWSGATDNVAVTSYDVYKNGVFLVNTASSPYTAGGLTLNTPYTFYVKAKDAAGNVSGNSNTVNVTPTDTTNPSAPTIAASNTTINSTDLSWSGATDNVAVTGYDVYKNSILIGSTTSATTFNVTGLNPGTDYAFNVKAKDAAGNLSSYSNTVNVTTLLDTAIISAKLYIEGYYDLSTHAMRPVRANQQVGVSTTDVDTVTLELRNASTYGLVATTTAMLQTNGMVTGTFNSAIGIDFYYLVIKHRNALQTWSANSIFVNSSTPLYNFSSAANKAYGDNMVELETGAWAFYSGDLNQDTNIDNADFSIWEADANDALFGYYSTDLNGDSNVDNADFSIWEANANNSRFVMTPP